MTKGLQSNGVDVAPADGIPRKEQGLVPVSVPASLPVSYATVVDPTYHTNQINRAQVHGQASPARLVSERGNERSEIMAAIAATTATATAKAKANQSVVPSSTSAASSKQQQQDLDRQKEKGSQKDKSQGCARADGDSVGDDAEAVELVAKTVAVTTTIETETPSTAATTATPAAAMTDHSMYSRRSKPSNGGGAMTNLANVFGG